MKQKKIIIALAFLAIIFSIGTMFTTQLPSKKIVQSNKITHVSISTKDPKANQKLETVKTEANFKKIFNDLLKDYHARYEPYLDILETTDSNSVNETTGAPTSSDSKNYSETNIQVSGVDEADIVKTDGEYIYQLSATNLYVVNAKNPKNLSLAKSINFQDYKGGVFLSPIEMFLSNKKLTIIFNSYKAYKSNDTNNGDSVEYYNTFDTTRVIVYDITNPENPSELNNYSIEANYISSRKINDIIYLITNKYIYEKNPELPIIYDSKKVTTIDLERTYIIPESTDLNLTNISTINLANPESEMTVDSFIGSSGQIYSSLENLYLTNTNFKFEDYSYITTSNIFKFGIDEQKINFIATTSIDGYIKNQFSMDEYENHLRVATTSDSSFKTTNTFYVLDENLSAVGKISDIAKGEQIKSVRFAGDKAYVVTFKQIDPLFVIDAKDPTKPKILGELKIPGYSTYLHPYDEDHLIGLGMDVELMNGMPREKGVKLSMFDITELNNPKEMFTEVIGDDGYSEALHNHKAFMFSKNKNLLVLPIDLFKYTSSSNNIVKNNSFNGAAIYSVDLNGFQQQKLITHNDNKNSSSENIRRSLFINETVFTISNNIIKSFDLKTNEVISTLKYKDL